MKTKDSMNLVLPLPKSLNHRSNISYVKMLGPIASAINLLTPSLKKSQSLTKPPLPHLPHSWVRQHSSKDCNSPPLSPSHLISLSTVPTP